MELVEQVRHLVKPAQNYWGSMISRLSLESFF